MLTLFSMGRVVITPGIDALITSGQLNPTPYLARHLIGDWGDVDAEDWQTNDRALEHGTRLLSAYNTPAGKIWIITEWDRSVTTMLLPEEY